MELLSSRIQALCRQSFVPFISVNAWKPRRHNYCCTVLICDSFLVNNKYLYCLLVLKHIWIETGVYISSKFPFVLKKQKWKILSWNLWKHIGYSGGELWELLISYNIFQMIIISLWGLNRIYILKKITAV